MRRRRSIRLQGYDYTRPGAYFVTICTYGREHLFGTVMDGGMQENELGGIVREEWFRTAQVRPYVRLYDDEFVVMPNHIHGIIWIVGACTRIIGGNHRPNQIHCHQAHQHPARHARRTGLATQLLGTHHPHRTGTERHQTVHPGKPSTLGTRPL